MVKKGSPAPAIPPEQQPDADLAQAAPVQNTWYTVLDTTPQARIQAIAVRVDSTGETVEVRLTIDGVTIEGSAALPADTTYYADVLTGLFSTTFVLTVTQQQTGRAFLIEGRNVKVEIRKTTAAGAGTLRGRVCYGKWT